MEYFSEVIDRQRTCHNSYSNSKSQFALLSAYASRETNHSSSVIQNATWLYHRDWIIQQSLQDWDKSQSLQGNEYINPLPSVSVRMSTSNQNAKN